MTAPKKLSPAQATKKIFEIASAGSVKLTKHCRDSMKTRDVDMNDILQVLKNGQVKRNAEWDDQHKNWKYRTEGYDVEQEELTVITVIFEEEYFLKILTVF